MRMTVKKFQCILSILCQGYQPFLTKIIQIYIGNIPANYASILNCKQVNPTNINFKSLSVWQHMVLFTVRQYECKSYRMFVEWLVEAYYLRMFFQLSHIPHYTTLQKLSARINGTLLEKIISSFILVLGNIRKIFTGIDSTGFKITHSCFTVLY
jgi:hypothetical protein